MKRYKNRKGFTIVELVIVIAVIAILAAVLIPTFTGVISNANKSARQQEVTNALKVVLASNAGSGFLAEGTTFVMSENGKPTYYSVYNGNKLGGIYSAYTDEQATTVVTSFKFSDENNALTKEVNKMTKAIMGYDTTSGWDTGAIKAIVAIFGEMYDAEINKVTSTDGVYTLAITSGDDAKSITCYTNTDLSSGTFVLVP